MRINLQPGYVLHSRSYRDSSQVLDVLTPEHGRLTLVAKGSRRRVRGGAAGAILQPFIPLLLSFSGRAEMKNLVASEVAGRPEMLRGERLFIGFYLNELLVRLLHRHDPHPELFALYGETLSCLASAGSTDEVLRRFEFKLMQELGYGFDLGVDGLSGDAVCAQHWYYYNPEFGMVQGAAEAEESDQSLFSGAMLLAMAGGEFGGPVRPSAKRLSRQALAGLLGDRPLRSRELFLQDFQRRSGRTIQHGAGHQDIPAGGGT
ncbi:MAG: DNA repair protein RecO [Halieaceae bacterium]|jgi:DNA repair protein RecO (recombination protein O)|nr:DNA repair protein RecO [Halieaceae bacterium]